MLKAYSFLLVLFFCALRPNEFNREIGSSRKEKEDILGNTKTIFYDKYGREVKSVSEKKEFIDNKNREKDNIEFDYFDLVAE
jgi:hypothetical protein